MNNNFSSRPIYTEFFLQPSNNSAKTNNSKSRYNSATQLLLLTILLISILALSVSVVAAQSDRALSKDKHKTSNAELCYHHAASSRFGQNYDRKTVSYCNRAIRFDNLSRANKAKTYINRGVLLKNMQRIRYANGDFMRARNYLRRSAELQVNIGNIAYLRGNFKHAVARFNKAIDMGLQQPHKALLNRGLAYERLGNLEAAERDYRRALRFNPTLNHAKERLIDMTTRVASQESIHSGRVASL